MRLLPFRIKFQPSVAYKNVAYIKKNLTLFSSFQNMKKWLSFMSLFLCLPHTSLGWKNRGCQMGDSEKIYEEGGQMGGFVYRKEGFKLFAYYVI